MICSIIIRSFNEERHIGRLLDGIERQILPDNIQLEIIVVDSGSKDSTVSIAKHMGANVISITKEDFSFGRALNIGCNAAKGDLFLFASAHVYPVYTDWIEKMITPFNNPNVALVYGRQIGNEVTRFSEHQVFAKWFPAMSNYNQATPFCNNANCAIRKSLWNENKFDETITGLEDLDWANKIIKQNYSIVYEAEAPIIHVHEEKFSQIKNRYQREAIALKQIMPAVHFSLWDFFRLFFGNTIIDFVHAIQKGFFFREAIGIIYFRFNQFKGTYLGYNQKGVISKELKNKFYYPKSVKRTVKNDSSRDERKIEY